MNIYNPFRRHVVRFSNGYYGVRRLSLLLGWLMLDEEREYWWYGQEFWPKYCHVTLEQAQARVGCGAAGRRIK